MLLNKFILGCANIGEKYGVLNISSENNFKKILSYFKKQGFNTIDTSPNYKNSEKVLKKNNLKNIKIINKFSLCDVMNNKNKIKIYASIKKLLKKSLENLGQNKFEAFMINDIEKINLSKVKILKKIINKLKKEKYFLKFGLSVYDIIKCQKKVFILKPDILQIPYNIVDRSYEKVKILKKMKSYGIKLHARSIFLQGILLDQNYKKFKYFKKWSKIFFEFEELVKKKNFLHKDLLISHVYNTKFIDKIVIGVSDLDELKKIIKFKNLKLRNTKNLISNDRNLIFPFKWRINE